MESCRLRERKSDCGCAVNPGAACCEVVVIVLKIRTGTGWFGSDAMKSDDADAGARIN